MMTFHLDGHAVARMDASNDGCGESIEIARPVVAWRMMSFVLVFFMDVCLYEFSRRHA